MTNPNHLSSEELYSGPEFQELDIDEESLDPRIKEVLLDFLLGGTHMPQEIRDALIVTLGGMQERMNIRFHEEQVRKLELYRSNPAEHNALLKALIRNPHKFTFLRASLAALYAQRSTAQPLEWAQADNAQGFQQEISRRNRAVLEVFIEIYEYAIQRLSGHEIPYREKPIDLTTSPIEFPIQQYQMSPELQAIMRTVKVHHLATIGKAMQDGHDVAPPKLAKPEDSFIAPPKDGLEGLPQMSDIIDEVDFRNTVRITAHGLHTQGHHLITPNLAVPLFPAIQKKFPKNDPMHAIGSAVALVSGIPAEVRPMGHEGILMRALTSQEMRMVMAQKIPEPDVD